MERASRLIGKLSLPDGAICPEELVRTAWPIAVTRVIARHTRPTRMVRTRLIVAVEDVIWQRQLFALTGQILRRLERHLGSGIVEDIEFRVVPPRREPHRAISSTAAVASAPDEADCIHDPVLRVIYKESRKKALA